MPRRPRRSARRPLVRPLRHGRAPAAHVGRVLRAGALAALLLGGPGLAAQDPGPPAPAPSPEVPEVPEVEELPPLDGAPGERGDRARPVEEPGMRASINGQAITAHDVLVEARASFGVRDPSERQLQAALGVLSREILLSEEARRLGLSISEYELDEFLRLRFDKIPDMEELARLTGTEPEFIRERYRRQLMALLYTRHRLGLDFRYTQLIPPDPRLKRFVDVRPSELKSAFERRREELAVPEQVHFRVLSFPDVDAASDGLVALGLGRNPETLGPPAERTQPVDTLREAYGDAPVVEWLASAPAGAVSEPIIEGAPPPPDGVVLLLQILERLPAREADFSRDQETLRRQLERERLQTAERELVLDEATKAVVWPRDLFTAPLERSPDDARPPASPVAPPR